MTDTLILSIDAMGGDHAPESVLEGVALSAKQHDDVFFFLFGNEEKIAPLAEKVGLDIPDNLNGLNLFVEILKVLVQIKEKEIKPMY